MEFIFSILKIFSDKFKVAMSFNVLSENVDYINKKNFYPKAKIIEDFLCKQVTKKFVVRHDYGLYEKTFYLYKDF